MKKKLQNFIGIVLIIAALDITVEGSRCNKSYNMLF